MNYEYGKIRKLADGLVMNNINPSIIKNIMENGEHIKKSDKNEKKSEWFYNATVMMDKMLKPALRYKIRQDCACCLGGKRHEICKKINKNYHTTSERIQAANDGKFVFGNSIKEKSIGVFEVSFFPEEWEIKKCPCIKGMTKEMSITYCYCCGGHVKYHLETILDKKLSVVVIETALSTLGKKSCKFELRDL